MSLLRFLIRQDSTRNLLALGLIAIALVFTLPMEVRARSITYKTIVLSGDASPGTGQGVSFRYLSAPVLNNAGKIVFRATLTGTGVDNMNDRGVFLASGSILELAAREGNAVPNTGPGVNYHLFSNPVLSDLGQTAYYADLIGTGVGNSNNSGIFTEFNGTQRLVARKGNNAPGNGPGVNFGGFQTDLVHNDAGEIAFFAVLTGTGVDNTNNSGIFSDSGGTVRQVAREGSAAPGTGPGVNFSGVLGEDLVLNNVGQIAFFADLNGMGVDSTNNSGIFSESGATLRLIARAGDAAPGIGMGVNFSGFTGSSDPVLNDAGQLAFRGYLTGTGVDSTNDNGIFSETGGILSLVARAGDEAPGTEMGVNFFGFGNPVLSNNGRTVISATLTGTGVSNINNIGIFSELGGTLGLVAREGNAAPGTGTGVNFRDFDLEPVLNDMGQTAFSARLIGTDVNSTNDRGIFATDPSGILHLIVREGDLFDVNPDPLLIENRTISFVNLVTGSGGSDGRANSFNNSGQLAFALVFTDDTEGIFIATIGVPEPASLAILGLGFLALLGSRRGNEFTWPEVTRQTWRLDAPMLSSPHRS